MSERLVTVDAELAQHGYRVFVTSDQYGSPVNLVDRRGYRRGGLEAVDVLTFCQNDLDALQPWITGAYATTGTEIDSTLRGEGLGTLMYERALPWLSTVSRSPRTTVQRVELVLPRKGSGGLAQAAPHVPSRGACRGRRACAWPRYTGGMKRQDLDHLVDRHLVSSFHADQLRKDGPLLDVEIHARCADDRPCPPIRGKGLVDTGADRTAVELTALHPHAKSDGYYWAQGVTSDSVQLPIYPLRVSFPGAGAVEVDRAAATPHLKRQGLVTLIGRDVLRQARLVYDGPTGTWSLALPEGTARTTTPSGALPLLVGGGVALALVALVALWPAPCPPSRNKTAGGPGSSRRVPIEGYTLRFVNNWPDSTYLGISFPGLCGGMVFTVLDYAHAGVAAPTTTETPSTSTPLGVYIHDRQADSLLGSNAANGTLFLSLLANPDDDTLAEVANAAFDQVRGEIDRGVPVPLGLIPAPWTLAVTNAHQVLATGYRVDPDGARTVVVWDPNYPTATTELRQAAGGGDLRWLERGGGASDAWRGFFVEEYTAKPPPAA